MCKIYYESKTKLYRENKFKIRLSWHGVENVSVNNKEIFK